MKNNKDYMAPQQRRRNYSRSINNRRRSNMDANIEARSYNKRRFEAEDFDEPGINFHASPKTIHRQQSAHFERYASEGNRFIHEVANELGTDNHLMAMRITKSVLHAIRDRVTPDDAVEFAQGLPTMLKAVYFEEYDLSKTPVNIRSKKNFIDFIRHKDQFAAVKDFPDPESVVDALHAVFRVLDKHMDPGQIDHLKSLFNLEIRHLIEYD